MHRLECSENNKSKPSPIMLFVFDFGTGDPPNASQILTSKSALFNRRRICWTPLWLQASLIFVQISLIGKGFLYILRSRFPVGVPTQATTPFFPAKENTFGGPSGLLGGFQDPPDALTICKFLGFKAKRRVSWAALGVVCKAATYFEHLTIQSSCPMIDHVSVHKKISTLYIL